MNQNELDFIALFRCAIHADTPKKSENLNIDAIKKLADRHNAWPLIFMALKDLYTEDPCDAWPTYRNAFFFLCVKNMQRMYALRKILSDLTSNGIPYAVLKGESLSMLYPHPECRISSDIDLYVAPENESAVIDILEKHNVQVEPRIPHAHHRDCHSRACGTIELHTQWQGDLQNDILFKNKLNTTEPFITAKTEALDSFSTLSVNDGLFMHFAHLFTHFVSGGFGVRLISDLLLYIRKYKNEIDEARFRSFLAELGYNKFFDALLGIGIKYLGFKKEDLFSASYEEDTVDLLMEDCISGGAFGHAETGRHESHEDYMRTRMENNGEDFRQYKKEYQAENDLEKLSFSTKNIKNLYPYMRKNSLLLPVAYLHHCCFIVRRGFVKLFAKKPTETAPLHENAQKRKPLFDKLDLK